MRAALRAWVDIRGVFIYFFESHVLFAFFGGYDLELESLASLSGHFPLLREKGGAEFHVKKILTSMRYAFVCKLAWWKQAIRFETQKISNPRVAQRYTDK